MWPSRLYHADCQNRIHATLLRLDSSAALVDFCARALDGGLGNGCHRPGLPYRDYWLDFASWGRLFAVGLFAGAVHGALLWRFFLNPYERAIVLAKLGIRTPRSSRCCRIPQNCWLMAYYHQRQPAAPC